jgi:hypothetical protein
MLRKVIQANPSETQVQVDVSGVATGNAADARDMLRLGRSQELGRNFRSFSVLPRPVDDTVSMHMY